MTRPATTTVACCLILPGAPLNDPRTVLHGSAKCLHLGCKWVQARAPRIGFVVWALGALGRKTGAACSRNGMAT